VARPRRCPPDAPVAPPPALWLQRPRHRPPRPARSPTGSVSSVTSCSTGRNSGASMVAGCVRSRAARRRAARRRRRWRRRRRRRHGGGAEAGWRWGAGRWEPLGAGGLNFGLCGGRHTGLRGAPPRGRARKPPARGAPEVRVARASPALGGRGRAPRTPRNPCPAAAVYSLRRPSRPAFRQGNGRRNRNAAPPPPPPRPSLTCRPCAP
jgi:hypothetical protein